MRPLLLALLSTSLSLTGITARAEGPSGRGAGAPGPAAEPAKPTAADAKAFVDRVNAELKRLWIRSSTADWIKATYITDDTERNAAALNEDVMAYLSGAIAGAVRFDGVKADPDTARMLHLLKVVSSLPAPSDPARRRELADLAAKLEGIYGKGKWCGTPVPGKATSRCRDLQDLEEVLARSRSYPELLEAWKGWHTISREMRPLYERLVALGNEGAKEIGFRDLGDLWRADYDMAPAAFEEELARLWAEVKPLYDELHCFVRAKLQKRYGKDKVPDGKPIPAHLLGNMWAQDWSYLYPLVEPYPGVGNLDVDAALRRQKYDPVRMVKLGEAFFTSLGFDPLPETFWTRSQLVKPRDREVVCHASAWDVTYDADVRIMMCIRPTEEDLVTIHHELGHNYYQRAYVHLPLLLQDSANDAFHEALGDAIALSVTPGYLKQVGLVASASEDERATINFQMKKALEKIAFLPFGLLIDQWRWAVFSGEVTPDRYNAAWWELRRKYQGVVAPVARSEDDFDPGAKYHIPSNVPYTRYFLAHVYQFQFHEALCAAAGWKGPLHECSIYGSRDAGKRLHAMMELGASRPWPEAYAALTGDGRPDASALLEYFAPLRGWLRAQTKGLQCGW